MHWNSKHRVLNTMSGESQRSFSSKNSIMKINVSRGHSGLRSGNFIATKIKTKGTWEEINNQNNDNLTHMYDPPNTAGNIDAFNTENHKVSAGKGTFSLSWLNKKEAWCPKNKRNDAENIRLNVMRNHPSTSDMFHCNQSKLQVDPLSSDSQRNSNRMNYKCAKNKNLITKSTNLSKNRSNSGIRNAAYLKSHQLYLQSNNQGKMPNYHNSIQNGSRSKNSSRKFHQGRKMSVKNISVNQMKGVSNSDRDEPPVLADRSNNYSSFHTHKGTSFRQSYTGSSSMSRKQKWSGKENVSLNALKIARKDIRGIASRCNLSKSRSNRSGSLSQSKSISRRKIKRSSGKKASRLSENIKALNQMKQDVEMEEDQPYEISDKIFNHGNSIQNDDIEMDEEMEDIEAPKPPVKQEFKVEKPLTDEEKLEYFHNFVANESKKTLIEEDLKTVNDPLECSEYVVEIFQHMKKTELDFIARPGYMRNQTDINEKMRAILIDWLIEVHLKFKLYPETLYLTVNLIDRYLEKEEVMRQHLQLVGVTAMLIASKYEEIYAPEVRDFVYITDKAYTKEEILKMEYKILTTLNFNTTTSSSYRFLERIYKLWENGDEKVFTLSRYFLELSLVEYRMLKHYPSMLASAALFLSMKILKKEHAPWTDKLKAATQFSEQQIRQCAKDLCVLLKNMETCSLKAVKKKFSEVSNIKLR